MLPHAEITQPTAGRTDPSMNSQPVDPGGDPNPYLARPHLSTPSPADLGVRELTTDECWQLVKTSQLGRMALDSIDGRPDLFPLNFLVHDGSLFVRSAPGTKLRSIAANPAVAFEVDGFDETSYWSVVIRANAHRMDVDADIEASGVLELVSWSPTAKHDFVQLIPVAISGRRFPRQPRRTWIPNDVETDSQPEFDGLDAGASSTDVDPRAHTKPHPIPHFAPPRP